MAAISKHELLATFETAELPSESPIWLRLLHVEKDGSRTSMVRDPDFFLSETGRRDPEAELKSNLRAFWSDDPNERAKRCRFPARYTWLSRVFDYQDSEGLKGCDEYHTWRERTPAGKLVLIFPSYQLNSPSSMFGHTLLRIDPPAGNNKATWLAQAVNFGAVNTTQDNSATYAFKGISGGYTGSFAVMPYFRKIQEYGHSENRDIWEYSLDFSEAETDWLVTHLWELRGIDFGYYFFDQNCSYRLLELLEVARPSLQLTQPFEVTAIPVDTIRELADQKLITTRQFRPSQERQLNDVLALIDQEQRHWMKTLRDDPSQLEHSDFQKLPLITRARLLQAAYGYTRHQDTDGDRQRAANRIKLLRAIKALPQETREAMRPTGDTPSAPEDGHYSRRLQFTYRHGEQQDSLLLSARMAFHSLNDNPAGYLQGAQINMFDLQLRLTEDNVRLEKLDFIDIASLVPSQRYFPHVAWKVNVGLAPLDLQANQKTGLQLTTGAGYSRALSSNSALYGLLDIHAEFNHRNGSFFLGAGPQVGLLTQWGPLNVQLNAVQRFSDELDSRNLSVEANYRLAKNSSIAVTGKRRNIEGFRWEETAELSIRHFFR